MKTNKVLLIYFLFRQEKLFSWTPTSLQYQVTKHRVDAATEDRNVEKVKKKANLNSGFSDYTSFHCRV